MHSHQVVFHAQTEETSFKIICYYGQDDHQCMVQQQKIYEEPLDDAKTFHPLHLQSFEECYAQIKPQLDWRSLHLKYVAPEWNEYVADQIVDWLNAEKLPESQWSKRSRLERITGHKFRLEYLPNPGDEQRIEIRNLVQFSTFEHDVLRHSHGDNRVEQPIPKATWTVYIDHEQSVHHDQVLMGPGMAKPMYVQGFLSVEGGCIVVRNKAGQTTHVYGTQHFSAVAHPLPKGNRKWVAWAVGESIS